MRVASTVKSQRAASRRSALTLVLLLAFTVQSFLVQTHLHALVFPAPRHSAVTISTQQNTPAPFDADKCILCQEFVHAGNYLLPAGIAVLPPNAQVSLLHWQLAPAIAARVISHTWMGRAPPRA